jgi:spore maturation protein CgeB
MSPTMIYVGDLTTAPDRDSSWISAFEALGWKVIPFTSRISEAGPAVWRRAALRFHCGAAHRRMRHRLAELCREIRPAWVHFRLPLAFTRGDIEVIRATGAIVTEYFNDDPFSPGRVPGLHRRFLRALPAYDAHFVYRQHNVATFRHAGGRHVEHCPPALDHARFEGMSAAAKDGPFEFDAAFIGHFEDDGRLRYLEALQEAGFRVAVHGSGWAQAVLPGPLRHLHPAAPIFGARYGGIYAHSLCGLCFFSKVNRDTWTERPLEIIAVGGLLVCERTDEAMANFKEGEEALFFSSPEELIAICRNMQGDPLLRKRITGAAHARLAANGRHYLTARATQIGAFVLQQQNRAGGGAITLSARPAPRNDDSTKVTV